jgi:hypothetical protein
LDDGAVLPLHLPEYPEDFPTFPQLLQILLHDLWHLPDLQLLHTLKDIKFTDIEEQGFMPVYERQEITDDLHETCGFRTVYQFITKRKMKGIQKKSKQR